MELRTIIESALKEAIKEEVPGLSVERIKMEDILSDHLDSIDISGVTLTVEEKLKLDHRIITEDDRFARAKTFEDLILLYAEHYNGTAYDKV